MANFKVRCIKTPGDWFTVGKIYDVINGYMYSNDHCKLGPFSNVNDINNNYISQFELYTGEEKTANFKVICTEAYTPWFTKGKVYDVVDGCIRDDYGTTHGYYPNFSAINHDLASQFKLYTGEEKMKNFKVICIKGYMHLFTTGKIYDVVEGEIIDDYGRKIGNFTSVDEINKRLIAQFNLFDGIYEYTNDSIMAFKNALNTFYGLPRFVKMSAIRKVIFNNPATIVIWSDGTKTVVKAEHEEFDPEKGLAMAISKKALGNKGNYYEEFKKWLPEEYKEESGIKNKNEPEPKE